MLDELLDRVPILRARTRQLHPIGLGDVEVGGQLASEIERQASVIANLLQRLQIGLDEGDALLRDTDNSCAFAPLY